MYVRVVRFADVSAERMQNLEREVSAAGGPPPGVDSTGITILHDEAQGTAVVLQHFSTAEAMDAAAKVFDAMDSGATPGARLSVDACVVKLELDA